MLDCKTCQQFLEIRVGEKLALLKKRDEKVGKEYMTIAPVLLQLLEDVELKNELKARIKEQIDSAAVNATPNPRDETEGNKKLLKATMAVVLAKLENLYGDGEDTKLYPMPLFEAQPQSQIVPLMEDHGTVAIVLGEYVRTWEEVFYDICHESLHLLNPVINVKGDKVKVSALEEGCAVKFAEQMYEKYINPYCDKIPSTSPANAPDSQYFMVYSVAKKIPDELLKDVRREFGRFSSIDDVVKFTALVGGYVCGEEVEVLIKPFAYR